MVRTSGTGVGAIGPNIWLGRCQHTCAALTWSTVFYIIPEVTLLVVHWIGLLGLCHVLGRSRIVVLPPTPNSTLSLLSFHNASSSASVVPTLRRTGPMHNRSVAPLDCLILAHLSGVSANLGSCRLKKSARCVNKSWHRHDLSH